MQQESQPILETSQNAADRIQWPSCMERLIQLLVLLLALPFQLLWFAVSPLILIGGLLKLMIDRCQTASIARKVDSIKEDPLVATSWGSIYDCLFAPSGKDCFGSSWFSSMFCFLCLPVTLAETFLAAIYKGILAEQARNMRWYHELQKEGGASYLSSFWHSFGSGTCYSRCCWP